MKALKPTRLTAALIFAAFILASASLLAAVQFKSFGQVNVGGQKVTITYSPDRVPKPDPRMEQILPERELDSEALRFARVIHEVGQMTSGMKMPESVHLNIAAIANSPSANSFTNVVQAGKRFGIVDEQKRLFTQHPVEMDPVIAHEFAHMIFFETVLMDFEFTRKGRALMVPYRELAMKHAQLGAQVEVLKARSATDPRAQAEIERVGAQIADLEQQLQKMSARLTGLLRIYNISSPYNEFFADVVAVLYSENSDAISDSIHFVTPNGKPAADHRRKLETRNRAFERRGSGAPMVLTGHGIFFRAREAIWDEYLSRPAIMKTKKSEVAKGVARAIRKELDWVIVQPYANKLETRDPKIIRTIRMSDFEAMNQRLIQQIRKELGSL